MNGGIEHTEKLSNRPRRKSFLLFVSKFVSIGESCTDILPSRVCAFGRWYSRIMTARITMEPGKRSGQPCIRGLRITVWDVLSWLAGGMTEQEILADYPELDADDFRAVYDFAAHMGKRVAL